MKKYLIAGIVVAITTIAFNKLAAPLLAKFGI